MQNSNSWPVIRYWNIEQRILKIFELFTSQIKQRMSYVWKRERWIRVSIVMCSCITLLGKSRISCSFFHHDFFLSLAFLLSSDQYKLATENTKPPFSLTCNLKFSIFPFFYCLYFYFSERAESNEKFFSRNQEVILSASLVGFCLIVIVGVMLYLFKRRVLLRQKT